MAKNINRLVWNNSFSNDKRLHTNKEAYRKKCKNCKEIVWMTPVNNGWRALDSTGKAHTCPVKPKKEKKNRVKKYMKYCNKCLQQIRMVNENGKWKPRDLDGAGHRCEKFSKVFDDIIKGD